MQHPERWKPSKYVLRGGRMRASRDPKQVGVGSRLVADITASLYEQHLPALARGRLIDLGCGSVPLYGLYERYVSEAVCVDWPGSVHGTLHVDIQADLSQPLPFEDGEFDTVVLSDVLEHLPEPWRLVREIGRILTPGGHAFVNVPFLYGIHESPHDYYRFTGFALRRFAAEAGLAVKLLVPTGGSLHVFVDFLSKHLAKLSWPGRWLASLLQALCVSFGRSAFGRRVADRTATRFPLGYFMVLQVPEREGPRAAS